MKKLIHKIPYFSQLSRHDWKERGFKDIEEAISWENRSCGIACIKMVLEMHEKHRGIPFADLIKEMESKGVYKEGIGCIHQGIADEFKSRDIESERVKIEKTEELKLLLDDGNICIVSVGPGFSEGRKTGHLVPVIGYMEENGQITSMIIHHTSSYEGWQWPEKEIDIERFLDHFSGNGIRVRL
jgi:hypothetical protein